MRVKRLIRTGEVPQAMHSRKRLRQRVSDKSRKMTICRYMKAIRSRIRPISHLIAQIKRRILTKKHIRA